MSRSEVPKLRTTLVDLSRDVSDAEIESFGEELRADSPEDEIALRGAARYVHRYVRCAESESAECLLPVRFGTTAYRLETGRSNTFDQLALRECDRVVPGPGQVEIRVAASGLNFSDVMKALGIYPGLPAGPVPLGIECSGTIVAVGPGVTAWTPDDEVVALAGFTFGAYTTTDARFVARKPPHLNFEEAATLPVTYLTAHYALSHLGNMRPGHRVLIHAATGGVGMAAVHLARRAGAEVFATAGTPEKRDLLRSLGIRHVMDSRSLAFADEVLAATDGRGVDLVLNSLAGDAIRKGLSVLADYGRFLEIGKRDIYANSRIGLKPFRKNVSFMAIDLDRSLRDRPDEVAAVFQEVMALCARGEVPSLPLRTFPISRVSAAFRYMAQAKHLGKVVVSVQDDAVRIVPKAKPPVRFRADATYLITGGLGGFGLVVARWMVDNGARHLVLMGRGGVKTEQAQTAVDAMQAAGANVMIGRADVTRPEDVERILDEIDGSMPPLRGVMHAAMVLEDCLLSNLNEEITRRVWRPKVTGAWNLHRLTRRRDLDFFVLFSSMASVFGIGGQACYASANACLDSLGYYRQSLGLPGVTISWGSLGEVGWVAEHEDIGSRLETMGVIGFSPRQALTALGRFLQDQPPHVGVMKVDWQRWFEASGAKQLSSKFADLTGGAAGAGQSDTGTGGGSALRSRLLAAGPLERRELLETALCEQIARLLGSTPDKLSLDKPLTDLGLDSLIAVELRNWIEGDLRLNLPIVELMRGPTIARLTDLLVGQLSREKAEPVAEPKSEKKPQEPQPAAEEIPDQTKEAEDASVIAAEMPTPARREPAVPRLTLQQLLSGADQYAQAIEFIRQAGAGVTEQSGHGVDLQKEAQLDSTIRPDSVSPPVASPARALLTGATGYIGAFLLADLLNKTDLEVHCLVRAGDARRAVQRIRDNLGMYDLWRDEFAHRVIPVVGDLGRPRLGLSPAEFDDLAQRIDIVYHAGAAVKFVAPYENLCDINVGGTREVLRFCSRTRCKPLQYISTLAVFSLVDHVELKVPRETDVPRHSGALFTGYPQSKWVAEQLVLEAQRRGLPATIYRLGLVTGHERTGVGNFSDFVSREILTCLQIGMTSDKDCSIDMTPVNYISEAVVALSRSADAAGRVFHLVNEHPMAWGHVFDYVRSRGFKVRSLPYGRWRRELGAHPDFASTPLYELATLFPPLAEDVRLSFPELRFDSSEAVERLAALGIRCPSLDERLLETYLRFAIESGRLPAPERQLSSSAEE